METTWWYNKFCGDKFIENIVKSRVWRTSRKIQDLFITYTSSRLICGRMRNNWVEKTRHGKMNIVKNQLVITFLKRGNVVTNSYIQHNL